MQTLRDLVEESSRAPVSPAVRALGEHVAARFGDSTLAVLFYGSCLRSGTDEGLVDLYVLVDDYRRAYPGRPLLALANRLLPPNVFYVELPWEGRAVRAKYAVLTLADFGRGTSDAWFHSYLWGRFAQPIGLLKARDEQVADRVFQGLGNAIATFVSRSLPQVPSEFTATDLWRTGLHLSYRAELRSERPERVNGLVGAAPRYYESATQAALERVRVPVERVPGDPEARYRADIPTRARRRNRFGWRLRAAQGKVLSVLRLMKGALTFHGGVDYIAWKIERHSGVRVEVPERLRERPFLAAVTMFWRLYRRGAFR